MSKLLIEDAADYVIVGTGAGGATAARVLAASGASVVMLEEGPFLKTKDRPRELLSAMVSTFRDFGTQTTSGDHIMPLLQGRMVGGSTAINSGIIWRLPEDVRVEWEEKHGLGDLVDTKGLERTFEILEDEMHIEATPEAIRGRNGDKMAEACRKLGLPGKPMVRNTRGCKGSSQCLEGCPNEVRQSMDVSYVPRAMKDGARLHVMCRADRVLIVRGRAVGVEGDVLDPSTRKKLGRFEVRARKGVIVAASVVYTPVLLRKSGVRGVVGDRFQAHPGAAVVGRFKEPIYMSSGATQAYEVPMRDRGFKLEALNLPPEMLATRLPGAGLEWQERLQNLGCYTQWAALVRMRAMGTIRPASSLLGGPGFDARYKPLPSDIAKMREGIALLCRMMFTVGAIEVFPGIARKPQVLKCIEEVRLIEEGDVTNTDFHMMASHLFGTAVAGSDPTRSAVGPDLQSHDVPGLYVMDASVFPTNLGVNPQHSIMALVWRAAERLANAERAAA